LQVGARYGDYHAEVVIGCDPANAMSSSHVTANLIGGL